MTGYYEKFIKLNKGTVKKIEDTIKTEKELKPSQNPSLDLVQEQLSKSDLRNSKGIFNSIRKYIFSLKSRGKKEKKIEIYDVIVFSK